MPTITPIPPIPHPYTAEGGANDEVTLQVNGEMACQLLWVGVAYSANVTKNVTVKYVSSLGTKYNVKLNTIVLTEAKDGFWLVDGNLRITADDYFEIRAPAGGAGVKCTITAMADPLVGADWVPFTRLIEGSVSYSSQNPTLGVMPPGAGVTQIEVTVVTAFNSDGGNSITIGHDDDHDAYSGSIDVSMTGLMTVSLACVPESVVRSVKVYYTAGGSQPTAGDAEIVLKYEVK